MGGARRCRCHRLYALDGNTMSNEAGMMNWFNENILTAVVFLPAIGAVLLAFFPRRDRFNKWFAMGIAVFTFIVSLHLPVHFHNGVHNFQFEIYAPWIGSQELNGQVSSLPTIMYHIGIDGISLWLVLLTTFLTP